MNLTLCHSTSKLAAEGIRSKRGFIPGKGGHDFLGPGVYGNVLTSHDIPRWRAGETDNCESVRLANEFARLKFGPEIESIFFSVSSRFILDLNESSIRPYFVEFFNVLVATAKSYGILLPEDEDYFRPRAHLASEAFRLVVGRFAGVTIDALLGRFSDLDASTVADSDPRHTVISLRPVEICVKNLDAIQLISGRVYGGVSADDVEFFDYTDAAKQAVDWLRRTTQARFISLLMSAIHPRGIGNATARPRPTGGVDLAYSSQFSKSKDGYAQIIEDRAFAAAKQCEMTAQIRQHTDAVSPEENRKWRRALFSGRSSLVVVLDSANATLSGMARSAVDESVPCLAIVSEPKFLDSYLWGHSNLLVVHLPMRQRMNEQVRSAIAQVLLGFMSQRWDASSPRRVETKRDIADALEGAKIPARIRRGDGGTTPVASVRRADIPSVAKAIFDVKKAYQLENEGDQLSLFDEQ